MFGRLFVERHKMYWEIEVRDTGDIEDYSTLDDIVLFPNEEKDIPEPHPLGKQKVIELSWGWTPFGDNIENYAEDAPTGHDSVFILEEQLPRLIEKLKSLL